MPRMHVSLSFRHHFIFGQQSAAKPLVRNLSQCLLSSTPHAQAQIEIPARSEIFVLLPAVTHDAAAPSPEAPKLDTLTYLKIKHLT